MDMKNIILTLAASMLASSAIAETVTWADLIAQIGDRAAVASFPAIKYRAGQTSSYDRRTISPNLPGWWANNDGQGFERLDTINGRLEKVLFDRKGPGVVNRIWMTTNNKRGKLRFYIDGSAEPALVLPAYDMSTFPVADVPGLVMNHTHYNPDVSGVGGNTFYIPIPYKSHCRITLEEDPEAPGAAHYYHIGYRDYPAGTDMETFSMAGLKAVTPLLQQASAELCNPSEIPGASAVSASLASGEALELPAGNMAVTSISIKLDDKADNAIYQQWMKDTRIQLTFDGRTTVDCPLAYFFSGGDGAPEVNCQYFYSDGKGCMGSRWIMPYAREASLRLEGPEAMKAQVEVSTVPFKRDKNTLYFHTTVKQEDAIPVSPNYDSDDNLDWNFATIDGRGVYVGDLLSLLNHCPDWYGEGDEKIYVDYEYFPSFMGTGTEDYYNCSWAPVVPFLTPYGGAPRADEPSSHGWNAFLRVRNSDAIPFEYQLRYDLEMLSWHPGTVDYTAVAFWYGD